MTNSFYVYILTNKYNTVLYIGITNDLKRRTLEHSYKVNEGFTNFYNIYKLVYFEKYSDPIRAINREKQLKKWSREKKNNLIETQNPSWENLSEKF